jgi:hypothetical protein
VNDGPKITLRYAKKLLRIGSGFDAWLDGMLWIAMVSIVGLESVVVTLW